MLLALVPCGLRLLFGTTMERLLGLQMASTVVVFALLLFAEGCARGIYFDVALTLALLSFAGGQTYARLLERWL